VIQVVSESRQGGFTLIELILVLTLIGLVSGIMLPRIDFQRARVDSAALQVSSNLLRAQRVAVMRQHDVRVSFDEAHTRVLTHQDANNDGRVDAGVVVNEDIAKANDADEGVGQALIEQPGVAQHFEHVGVRGGHAQAAVREDVVRDIENASIAI